MSEEQICQARPYNLPGDVGKISCLKPLKVSYAKLGLLIFLSLITAGIFLLFVWWYVDLQLSFVYSYCNLDAATHLLVVDEGSFVVSKCVDKSKEIVSIEVVDLDPPILEFKDATKIKVITYKLLKYYYDTEHKLFVPLHMDYRKTGRQIHKEWTPLEENTIKSKQRLYGKCVLDVSVPIWKLIFEEILNPLYLFQLFSIVVWTLDEYYYFSAVIGIVLIVSTVMEVSEKKKHLEETRDLAHDKCEVKVHRRGKEYKMKSEELVPGDLFEVPLGKKTKMPCDAVIIKGTCMVNESMLTGESVHILKSAIPSDDTIYNPDDCLLHSLYKGTKVTNSYGYEPTIAVVVRTGFITKKGNLIRSILYSKPLNLDFYSHVLKFLAVVGLLTIIGFIISLSVLLRSHLSLFEIVIRACDLFTITIPPELPVCLSIGHSLSMQRLRENEIFCISRTRINAAGEVSYICLDKTGTLTVDSFTFNGVLPIKKSGIAEFGEYCNDINKLSDNDLIVQAMAMCHSLGKTKENVIVGDPLEAKLLAAAKWEIKQVYPDGRADVVSLSGIKGTIIRRFPFNSNKKRMSTLVKMDSGCTILFTKGAPDILKSKCISSTCPLDYDNKLSDFTSKKLTSLAVAYKLIPNSLLFENEDKLVQDLQFLGWVFLKNSLRPKTVATLERLCAAKLPIAIVTGDYHDTAIAVAKECGILPPNSELIVLSTREDVDKFANSCDVNENTYISLNESAFSRFLTLEDDQTVKMILKRAKVYARMSPDQKAQLIKKLQKEGESVCMCGDGVNDCEALNTANTGISISSAEFSVAAPFTSKKHNILCVEEVLKEGRATQMIAFQFFKFLILSSFIQFASTILVQLTGCFLTEGEYLFLDLFLVWSLAITMCK